MLVQELIRTCANARIAEAAVSSLGRNVCSDIEKAAARHNLGVGDYTSRAVLAFARSGDEADMRKVALAMCGSQEPILAGLQIVLFSALANEGAGMRRTGPNTLPHMPAYICNVETRLRRELLG